MSKFAATKYTYSFLHAKTQKKQSTNFVVCHLCDKEQKNFQGWLKNCKIANLAERKKKERASKCKNDLTIVDGDISCIYF